MVNETTHMGGGRRLFMRLFPKIATVALILHLFQLSPYVSDMYTVQSTSHYCKINPTTNMWEKILI